MYIVQYGMYNLHCQMYNVYCLLNMYCYMYNVHCTLYVNAPQLFNMAITRAKDWLIVVGDPYTLCTVGPNR